MFITPESLFIRPRVTGNNDSQTGTPVFRLAVQAIKALRRLKEAGFMIIGVAGEEFFRGFASPHSCEEFLAATELDDVIISRDKLQRERTSSALIQAAGKWLLDLDQSFIIGRGDEISNANLTGCTPLKIIPSKSVPIRNRSKIHSLGDAVDRILSLQPKSATTETA